MEINDAYDAANALIHNEEEEQMLLLPSCHWMLPSLAASMDLFISEAVLLSPTVGRHRNSPQNVERDDPSQDEIERLCALFSCQLSQFSCIHRISTSRSNVVVIIGKLYCLEVTCCIAENNSEEVSLDSLIGCLDYVASMDDLRGAKLLLLPSDQHLIQATLRTGYRFANLLGYHGFGSVDLCILRRRCKPCNIRDSEQSNIGFEEIFLLLGQSNMSGRGGLGESCHATSECYSWANPSEDSISNQRDDDLPVYWFDVGQTYTWQKLLDPMQLHRCVDRLKTVGIGPGGSFGQRFAQLSGTAIGLVPGAVGATALSEWQPENRGNSSGPIISQKNADYHQNPNLCSDEDISTVFQSSWTNLMGSAMRSLYQALVASVATRGEFLPCAGVLWYQGENDASLNRENAEKYDKEFARFLKDLRKNIAVVELSARLHCNLIDVQDFKHCLSEILVEEISCYSPPPVITVAVTTTRPYISYQPGSLTTIRDIQLQFPKCHSTGCPWTGNIDVIDAFGLFLKSDNIHLTASSATMLGKRMAEVMHSKLSNQQTPTGSAVWGCRDGMDLFSQQKYYLANYLYSELRKEAEQRFLSSGAGFESTVFPVLRCGLKPANFVYGEVDFSDLCMLVEAAVAVLWHQQSTDLSHEHRRICFTSLGCGSGPCIAAALLSNCVHQIMGYDLLSCRLRECIETINLIQSRFGERWSIEHRDCFRTVVECKVEFELANFLSKDDWVGVSNVVYSCSTCYTTDVVDQLVEKLSSLQRGSVIILIDFAELHLRCARFQALFSKQCSSTWGPCNAFVYLKLE